LEFPPASLGGIHAANVLHFLTGDQLVDGASRMFRWLRPGGKVFTLSSTPFVGTLRDFIPIYQRRKGSGVPWPGELGHPQVFSDHATVRELPDFVHLLEEDVLREVFCRAGFVI